MMHGARKGPMNGVRRLIATAMAHDLSALVVPGPDVARSWGLDFAGAGLRLAATPRHANVLVIVGPLPAGLMDAAVVAYAQMPRPRSILALDAGDLTPLPSADATGDLSQRGLLAALTSLRPVIANGAFAEDSKDFDAPALQIRIEYTCPMHAEIIRDAPGSCPKCGMTLVPRETAAGGHAGHGNAKQAASGRGETGHDKTMHSGHGKIEHGANSVKDAPPRASKSQPLNSNHDARIHQAVAPKYVCSMHPEVVSDSPGSCPICGMTLVKPDENSSTHDGHGKHKHDAHKHSAHGDSAQAAPKYACPMHPEVTSDSPGSCPKCGMTLVKLDDDSSANDGHGKHKHGARKHSAHGDSAQAAPKYACPMHPEVTGDSPGFCPKCGMTLVKPDEDASAHGGHDKHSAHKHSTHGDSAQAALKYACPMHPEVTSDSPGSCPKCGMTLVKLDEDASAHGGHDKHGAHKHSTHGDSAQAALKYACPMHPEVTSDSPGSCPKCGMTLVKLDEDTSAHGGHAGHSSHNATGQQIDGIEPNFMSMVDLTKDMPASPDGLKMDWIEVPFGPFFPGLPGGLGLHFTLDGDTVVKARANGLTNSAIALPKDGLTAQEFTDRLAALSPLSPVAMRQLACLALESVSGQSAGSDLAMARAMAVERERISSHLGWLAGFATQTGLIWLERQATALQLTLRGATAEDIAGHSGAIGRFLQRVQATMLLRAKLAGIGQIHRDAPISGPVARAAGLATDVRLSDPTYQSLGFKIQTRSDGDALARLGQRCDEIAQSLDLMARVKSVALPAPGDFNAVSGKGEASVETPRGVARLQLDVENGRVTAALLELPSAKHMKLIDPMTRQLELADALVAVASLDLDPWGAAS